MKTQYLIFVIVLSLSACGKSKCVDCENTCYYCEFLDDTLCSTDFNTTYWLESAIEVITNSGDVCHLIEPTIKFEECDDEKKEIFNSTNYQCLD